MTTKLTPPPAFDNSKLHTREEYRAWQDACYEYAAALRAEEQRATVATAPEANRPLTEDEYRALAVQREEAKQQRLAEAAAAEQAKADAAAAYLASQPDFAEVSTSNSYAFVQEVLHWGSKGYVLADDADITMLPTYCAVKLNAPAASAKKAK